MLVGRPEYDKTGKEQKTTYLLCFLVWETQYKIIAYKNLVLAKLGV